MFPKKVAFSVGLTALMLAMMLSMGCNKPEETPKAEPEVTAPAAEPADDIALNFTVGEAPAGDAIYKVDAAETDISFVIVSNSAGPVTGNFPDGASGWLNLDSGEGKFSVQLDTLKTLAQDGVINPVRDQNIIEAFFGVRPSAIAKEAVAASWDKLKGKLLHGVADAGFDVSSVEGLSEIADGAQGAATLKGRLILWDSVAVDLSIPIEASRSGNTISFQSTEAVSIDLEQVLGTERREMTFATMLAAGCAHQPGIQNEVSITLKKVTLHHSE